MKEFRYDIGFLRAIAVIAVVLFHYKIPFFEGGFIGVDVFFVISGFLMTKIILNGFDTNSFSLKDFYYKRIKRIIPALLFVTVIMLLVAQCFLLAADLQLTAKYALLSNVFVSNIYYWMFNGYFDPSSQDNMFLHTWSLGVEWQFYMIYPIILLAMKSWYHKNIRLFKGLFLGLTVLSFVLNIALLSWDRDFTFYMFPTRAWEMLLGGWSFLFVAKFKHLNTSFKKYIVLASYTLIAVSVFLCNEQLTWPSYYSLVPVLSTTIILLLNVEFKIFKNDLIQFFGNTSYSWYLWHWPLYVVMVYLGKENYFNSGLLIGASLIMAYFSYKFIESNKMLHKVPLILSTSIVTIAVFSFLFINPVNWMSKSFSLYTEEVHEVVNYNENYKISGQFDKQFNSCGCFITTDYSDSFNASKCLRIDKDKKNVLLLGDSHAAQFSLSLREKMNDMGVNVLEASAGFALPVVNTSGVEKSKKLMNYVFDEFIPKNHESIDLVIISAHWLGFDKSKIGFTETKLISQLNKTVDYFKQHNIKYVFIGQTESYVMPFPKVIGLHKEEIAKYIDKKAQNVNLLIKRTIQEDCYIDVYNLNLIKFNKNGNIPYMKDDNHLSKFGSDQVLEHVFNNNKFKIKLCL